VYSQEQRESQYEELATNLWLGSYNKFRLTEKLYYWAEFHYRRQDYQGSPFVGRMAQLYNRHALNYFVLPGFNISVGGVLRLDFTPDPDNEELTPVLFEPRIWHEYLFTLPFPRFQVYHRIRIEHRWSRRSFSVGNTDWIFRNRWRYKAYAKIPVNKPTLSPGAFYINPEAELIMQSGSPVVDSPFEDIRLSTLIGYIASPRVTYSFGPMYTTGQRLRDGSIYRRRWILRLNAYVSLDFRKEEKKLPTIRASD